MLTVANIILICKVIGPIGFSTGNVILAEKKRSIQLDLDEKTKEIIQKEGIYHFTTRENALKIMKSGFLMPSVGKTNNHYSKTRDGKEYGNYVYMFAGKPNFIRFAGNLAHRFGEKSDGTFYAIRHKPNKFELENYTKRLSDGAITYEGRLDLENSNPEIVRMKLDFKSGKLVEIPLDAEVKKETFHKRLIKNSVRKAIGFGGSMEMALADFISAPGVLFSKKAHRLIEKRRLTNKLLEQLNEEKVRLYLNLSNKDADYMLSQGNDKIVDGRLMSEFKLNDTKSDKEKSIYTDSIDFFKLPADKLKEYFENNIDFQSDLNQYIGKPVEEGDKIVNEMDTEFSDHFKAKQITANKTQPLYDKLLEQKSKKQYGIFKRMYEKTSAKKRDEAKDFISKLKFKQNENKEAEHEKQDDLSR